MTAPQLRKRGEHPQTSPVGDGPQAPDYDALAHKLMDELSGCGAMPDETNMSSFVLYDAAVLISAALRQAHAEGAREAGEKYLKISDKYLRGYFTEADDISEDLRAAFRQPAKESG